MRTVWKNCITGLAAVALLVIAYLFAHAVVGNELLVPSFSDCMKGLGGLLISGGFWRAFFSTFLRVLCAFTISFGLAVVFAIVAYLLPIFARFFAPIVAVLRSVPTLAVLLIVLVWTGSGVAPVVVAFLTLFPTLYAGLYAALLGVDRGLAEMSRVYRVPLKRRVFSLYLPSIAPLALREGAAALGLALKLVASAEVLAGTYASLGGLMQEAKAYLDMPLLFALVCVTFLLGLALEALGNLAALAVERRAL
ncbi:MAG: ABC transporter permease subunit [Clostridia bacterium]|nr:ABC transporter permease subunit [Clostridia bacterium]